MLLPTSCGDPEDEYWRLSTGAQIWDVAAQRQVGLVEAAAEPGSSVSVSINGQVYGGQLVTLPFIG